jgi:hypothetical protein
VGNGGAILTSIGTVRLGNVTLSENDAKLGDAIASFVSIVTLSGVRFQTTASRRRRYLKETEGKPAKEDRHEDDEDERDDRDSKYSSKDSGGHKPVPAPVHVPAAPTLAPVRLGLGTGNLIYIADDMAPTMSFVDCDTDPRVAFCDKIDVFEVGVTFLNTNCRVNGRDELSDECEVH